MVETSVAEGAVEGCVVADAGVAVTAGATLVDLLDVDPASHPAIRIDNPTSAQTLQPIRTAFPYCMSVPLMRDSRRELRGCEAPAGEVPEQSHNEEDDQKIRREERKPFGARKIRQRQECDPLHGGAHYSSAS
jgi:hypothetical protein